MEEHLSNDRIISYHRQKENYQPSPPNSLQFAYGDFRYEKMTLELFKSHDSLKLKTLEEINEDFHRGDFITLALLSSDILVVLIKHLENTQSAIRELSSRAIVLVCSEEMGRDHIMKNGYVKNIMKLFDDEVEKIRENAYKILLNLSEFQSGIDHILDKSVMNPLVDKLVEEPVEQILILVLQLMQRTLSGEQGQVEILRTPGIKRLTSLLTRENFQIRHLACLNLQAISYSEKGKSEVINQGCVLQLVKRLEDDHEKVIEAASMALASLAQKNEAKFQIIDNGKLHLILRLLEHQEEQIKLNIVQLIASLAEHPIGRKNCMECLGILKEFTTNHQYEYIAPYAKQAIEIILWTP